MAFIARNVERNLGTRRHKALQEAANQFEQDMAAPLRITQPGDTREIDRALTTWAGETGQVNYYPGFTEADIYERGVTIFMYGWEADLTQQIRRVTVPGNMWEDGADGYFLEFYTAEAANITQRGGVPLTFPDQPDQPWGSVYHNGRVLFIGAPVDMLNNYGRPMWNKWLFDPLREQADPAIREAAAQRREEIARRTFADIMKDQGNVAVETLREQMETQYEEFADAQEIATNLKATLDQNNRQLTLLLKQEGEMTDEQIRAEWDKLGTFPLLDSFTFGKQQAEVPFGEGYKECDYMRLRTKEIWLDDPENEGRKLPLGEYTITLNFGLNSVRIINDTRKQEGTWDHPHVRNGKLCVGEFGPTITNLLRQRKIGAMTNMLFRLLRIIRTENDDWGRNALPVWRAADDQLREREGWPAWEPGEATHPLLARLQEQENTTGTEVTT